MSSKHQPNKSKTTQGYAKFGKKVQPQPNTSWAEYKELEDIGKDFESLANVPITSDRFIPKSEKHWSVNISHFSQLFSLDSNVLSLAMGCIPFNEFIEIPDDLLTSVQLSEIHNTVAESKSMYKDTAYESQNETKCETKDDILDFLLTLKEPVNETPKKPGIAAPLDGTRVESNDLEEWLDSILNE